MSVNKLEGGSIFSFDVYELPEGVDEMGRRVEKDYHIVAKVRMGGISLEFDRTIDQIRNFFTERRERQERKHLAENSAVGKRGKKRLRSVLDKE